MFPRCKITIKHLAGTYLIYRKNNQFYISAIKTHSFNPVYRPCSPI